MKEKMIGEILDMMQIHMDDHPTGDWSDRDREGWFERLAVLANILQVLNKS